ncbi:MAG: type II toxin-antitoxin system RelB/DinJ family antitoxin [Planctomycetota bacterium]|jgi:addiction module RelB/DinJ family antitoxin|nr:type II toxin-antitoxin system RelB/DinJ family antitoxin [Planctomycetota bacterium]
MPNDALLQVRLDAKTKTRAEKFFKRFGLSASDGVRLLINQAMTEKTLPRIPNAETRKAIEECRAGRGEIVPMSELKERILGKSCGR